MTLTELTLESYKMLIPYTLIMILIGFFNMIFFNIIVNNLFSFIAYLAGVDVIATGTLPDILGMFYLYPIFLILFLVIGIAVLMQYIFLINVMNMIYVSTKENISQKVLSKEKLKELLVRFFKKIKIVPVLVYFVYFILLLSLFGINIENIIVSRIDISDVITSAIYSNTVLTILFILFKLGLLVLIAILTPFIFNYALKDCSVKECIKDSFQTYKNNRRSIYLFLLIMFGITMVSELYSYFIGDSLFYDLYTAYEGFHFREIALIIVSFPILVIDEFVTILFLLYFIHIFFDDDEHIDIENEGFARLVKTKKYKFLTIIFVLVLVLSEFMSFQLFFEVTETQNQIMVHRGGGNEVFENTSESIEYSMSKNYPAIEIDTMELKDGNIILIHDKTLQRISNRNLNVKDLTLEEIKEIQMIGGYDFITLEEALELVKNDDIIVNIEMKYHGFETDEYVSTVVEIIEFYQMEDRVYVSSFDYDDLLEVEVLNAQIKTMYFSFFFVGNLSNLQVDAVGVDVTYLTADQFNTLKSEGYEVAIFTVNKKKDMITSLSYELDYIISDEPESLEELIESVGDLFTVN